MEKGQDGAAGWHRLFVCGKPTAVKFFGKEEAMCGNWSDGTLFSRIETVSGSLATLAYQGRNSTACSAIARCIR